MSTTTMQCSFEKPSLPPKFCALEIDEANEDREEIEAYIKTMTRQRNRTARIVNRGYTNQDKASSGNIRGGLI
jgi:hypothetical protein